MAFFQPLEGDMAVLVSRGVYRQCRVYTRHGYLFAAVGAGYVRLCADGSTSSPAYRLADLETQAVPHVGKFGWLCTADCPDAARAWPGLS